jgi:hypothetical protein
MQSCQQPHELRAIAFGIGAPKKRSLHQPQYQHRELKAIGISARLLGSLGKLNFDHPAQKSPLSPMSIH